MIREEIECKSGEGDDILYYRDVASGGDLRERYDWRMVDRATHQGLISAYESRTRMNSTTEIYQAFPEPTHRRYHSWALHNLCQFRQLCPCSSTLRISQPSPRGLRVVECLISFPKPYSSSSSALYLSAFTVNIWAMAMIKRVTVDNNARNCV